MEGKVATKKLTEIDMETGEREETWLVAAPEIDQNFTWIGPDFRGKNGEGEIIALSFAL